jgi:Zn-dependent M32 family carboxypeptidase
MFESGMTQKEYDNFFGLLVEKLSPIISELKDTNKDTFLHKFYPLDKQRKFNEILLQYLGFDKEHFY